MSSESPIRVANISESPQSDWIWIANLIDQKRAIDWQGFSTSGEASCQQSGFLSGLARRNTAVARFHGVRQFAKAASSQPFDLVVSHGPWVTAWLEGSLGRSRRPHKHLAFSFNFTDLPTGPRFKAMRHAFSKVDKFAVFTQAEIELYSNYFDIEPDRFLRAPWGVSPPLVDPPARTGQ